MGIVNLTPDSFSDGGQCADATSALRHAERLVREGADILDVGAESTRPGAPRVSAEDEWARLAPVLPALLRMGVPISVDTCKTAVMARALDLGADIINDVQALHDAGAEALLAGHPQAGMVLMHMRGTPADMQQRAQYVDVAGDVASWLNARTEHLLQLGVQAARIVLDPGFGFAKTAPQNVALQRGLGEHLARPWLAGWSRKSTLGWLTGAGVADRLPASLAAAQAAVAAGAKIVRVHDVAPTLQVLRVWRALQA